MRRAATAVLLPLAFVACVACSSAGAPDPAPAATPSGGGVRRPTDAPASGVGNGGGAVDNLFFAFHGDTRPPNCNSTGSYPIDIINNIYATEAGLGVQFAVDLGDHVFACSNAAPNVARDQMALYMGATTLLGAPTFMTMGNHECSRSVTVCAADDNNYVAYLDALKPISPRPYYSIDVQTGAGLARFVFIADNAWDDTQQAWLEATLTDADANATYTFVMRHHGLNYKGLAVAAEWNIIKAHKYTLFLAGHSHSYSHDTTLDPSGRSVRLGNGGAPLVDPTGGFFGFGTVQQNDDNTLTVSIYDQADGTLRDSFDVDPQ